jgi:hypothetical protein
MGTDRCLFSEGKESCGECRREGMMMVFQRAKGTKQARNRWIHMDVVVELGNRLSLLFEKNESTVLGTR